MQNVASKIIQMKIFSKNPKIKFMLCKNSLKRRSVIISLPASLDSTFGSQEFQDVLFGDVIGLIRTSVDEVADAEAEKSESEDVGQDFEVWVVGQQGRAQVQQKTPECSGDEKSREKLDQKFPEEKLLG